MCSSKTAEENEENIIKLNVSPNRQNIKYFASYLVIEFHAGEARFEITTALLLVVKNDIETLNRLQNQGAHYTRVNTVYGIQFIFQGD